MAMSNAEVQALPLNQVREEVGVVDQLAKVRGVAATPNAAELKKGSLESLSVSDSAVRAELQEAVGAANEKLLQRGQKLDIGVDEESGTIVIRVSDQKTGEMIRQMPSEEALRITRSIDRLTGILVDQKE
jgi:flagellar protein FlaG